MSTEIEQFELPNIPAPGGARQLGLPVCTRENYKARCEQRYNEWCYRDAMQNWASFEEHRETFRAWVEHFGRDPFLSIGAKCHNAEGTLSGMAWVMQTAIEPDHSKLFPCLDFEEHYQKVFLRRGLVIYLTLLLEEAKNSTTDGR